MRGKRRIDIGERSRSPLHPGSGHQLDDRLPPAPTRTLPPALDEPWPAPLLVTPAPGGSEAGKPSAVMSPEISTTNRVRYRVAIAEKAWREALELVREAVPLPG